MTDAGKHPLVRDGAGASPSWRTTIETRNGGFKPLIMGRLQNTIQDIIPEGDKVTYRWIMLSTNQTTGKRQVIRGITLNRIVDGKIVEDWYNYQELMEAEVPTT